ncbi:MAG: Ig-like domain-containing protein, partial [Sediminibacterium sp.]
MKLNYSLTGSNLLHACKSYSGKFNNKWFLLLLLFIFSAGCKKVVEQTGLVGVCPVVVSTDPLDKAVDVAYNKLISATFNTDINPSSINKVSFTIKQGNSILPGTVAATSVGTTFTFKPDVPLLPFVKYTGTITTAAIDKFNTAMVADYVWSFTTIPQLTVTPNLAAGGTVGGAGTFAQGSTVTVSATPKTGYTFTNWTDSAGTTVLSTSPSFQFTMAGNRALIANFTVIPPAQYAVVTSSNPVAGGSTFGSGSYVVGSTVTVIESPNPGYTFVNWTEAGTIVSTNSSYQFTITANKTLVANFTAIPALQYAVLLSSNPAAGGTTTGAGSYTAGTSVTISATPNTGYTFANFTENGVVISTSSTYTFAITATRILVANFTINTYTLAATVNPAASGTITKTPDQPTYDHGTQVVLT